MSTFLCDTLRRVCSARGLSETDYLRCVAQSLMVSADNAHGVHPNHPEKAALTNRPSWAKASSSNMAPDTPPTAFPRL